MVERSPAIRAGQALGAKPWQRTAAAVREATGALFLPGMVSQRVLPILSAKSNGACLLAKRKRNPSFVPRLSAKPLQSGHPTLVQLMYKLEPSEFRTEDDINKLIKYLEQSPLNRQALPDAGNKIGNYYRRLRRRPGETVPAFLVREDRTHDEMLKALQRLLRDKALDFEPYEVSMEELRNFCGFRPGQSLYFGQDDHDGDPESGVDSDSHSQRSQSRRTSTPNQPGRPFSGAGSQPEGSNRGTPRNRPATTSTSSTSEQPVAEGKDLLQRLMEKGLLPLAALDVIRGWMVLEMSTQTDEDRRLIRAATQNKLGYTDIRQALLSMYEEKTQRIPLDRDRKGLPKGGKSSVS